MTEFADTIARGLEFAGIVVITVGVIYASAAAGWGLATRQSGDIYRQYRRALGRAILLGLEILVAADIIGTVAVAPSWPNVGVLAVIVLIRTVLSFSLQIEIEGTLPWRRAAGDTRGQE